MLLRGVRYWYRVCCCVLRGSGIVLRAGMVLPGLQPEHVETLIRQCHVKQVALYQVGSVGAYWRFRRSIPHVFYRVSTVL
eukprot:3118971-Rhodomonas_salina.1